MIKKYILTITVQTKDSEEPWVVERVCSYLQDDEDFMEELGSLLVKNSEYEKQSK